MDYDTDGIDDVIAGSIYEDIYLFRGLGKGKFAKRKLLRDKNNNPIKGGYCCATELVDMDADGDLDLVCANRISKAKWFECRAYLSRGDAFIVCPAWIENPGGHLPVCAGRPVIDRR